MGLPSIPTAASDLVVASHVASLSQAHASGTKSLFSTSLYSGSTGSDEFGSFREDRQVLPIAEDSVPAAPRQFRDHSGFLEFRERSGGRRHRELRRFRKTPDRGDRAALECVVHSCSADAAVRPRSRTRSRSASKRSTSRRAVATAPSAVSRTPSAMKAIHASQSPSVRERRLREHGHSHRVVVEEAFEGVHALLDALGRRRNVRGVAGPRASDPVLRAAELAGLLVGATSLREQHAVDLAQQAVREREAFAGRARPCSSAAT